MNNIGTAGVFFIWIMLFWPVIVVFIYYPIFRPNLSHPYFLGVISVVIGYVIPGLIDLFVEKFIVIDPSSNIILIIFTITPVATTHALAAVFSRRRRE